MKRKNMLIDMILALIATICVTVMIQPVMMDVVVQDQELMYKKSEQLTTKAISLFAGQGEIIKSSQIVFPKVGDKYALIHNDQRGFSKDLYFGDTPEILDIAIGQYSKSGIPGQNKPILLAGHNGTHFRLLSSFEIGDEVQIDTSYGTYVYEVSETEIMNFADFDATVLNKEEEELILYTCYPFDVISTDQRYFVYAKKISGPMIAEVGTWSE